MRSSLALVLFATLAFSSAPVHAQRRRSGSAEPPARPAAPAVTGVRRVVRPLGGSAPRTGAGLVHQQHAAPELNTRTTQHAPAAQPVHQRAAAPAPVPAAPRPVRRNVVPALMSAAERLFALQTTAHDRTHTIRTTRETVRRDVAEAWRSQGTAQHDAHEAQEILRRADRTLGEARSELDHASVERHTLEQSDRGSTSTGDVWETMSNQPEQRAALESAILGEAAAVSAHAKARADRARATEALSSTRERHAAAEVRLERARSQQEVVGAELTAARAHVAIYDAAVARSREIVKAQTRLERSIAVAAATTERASAEFADAREVLAEATEAVNQARTAVTKATAARHAIKRGSRVGRFLGGVWNGITGEATPGQLAAQAEATALTREMRAEGIKSAASTDARAARQRWIAAREAQQALEDRLPDFVDQVGAAMHLVSIHESAGTEARAVIERQEQIGRELETAERLVETLSRELDAGETLSAHAQRGLEVAQGRLDEASFARQRAERSGSARGRSAGIWGRARQQPSRAEALEAAILAEARAVTAMREARTVRTTANERATTTLERATAAHRRASELEAQGTALDAELATITAEVEQAERTLEAEIEGYERSTLEDQSLRGMSAQRRAAHERASERFKLVTALVSKPHEVSQDAFATNPEAGLFAVADGVTNSRFSGEFARELVRAWATRPPAEGESFAEWIRPIQERWAQTVAPARAAVEGQWFNRGAAWVGHATFVGLELRTDGPGGPHLRGLALGDAVMIVVRDGQVVRPSWPNDHSSDFSNETQALASAGEQPWQPRPMDRAVQAGDEVFVLSDAIGSWTLREVEAGRNPFQILRRLNKPRHMQRFVDTMRDHPRHGNRLDVDDTTLVRFVVPST